MKRIITILLTTILFTTLLIPATAIANYSDDFKDFEFYTSIEIADAKIAMEKAQLRMDAALQILQALNHLDYDKEKDNLRVYAENEYAEAKKDYCIYEAVVKREHISKCFEEYPAATIVWEALISQGMNEHVAAGIMGNMMAEVGGQTLTLDYTLRSTSGYYGLCQWSKSYSKVRGADLQDQVAFLLDTIQYEIDTYGYKYHTGFNYNKFLQLEHATDAALAFAKTYERCGSSSYKQRQNNAVVAYYYFVQQF